MSMLKTAELMRMGNLSFISGIHDTELVLAGRTGVAWHLGLESIGFTTPTKDTDILTNIQTLRSLARKAKSIVKECYLIDEQKIRAGSMGGTDINRQSLSPFKNYYINHPYFDKMDFFLTEKSIGPIPFREEVFERSSIVTFEDTYQNKNGYLRIAPPEFLIATYTNPLAANDKRIKNAGVLFIKESEKYESLDTFADKVIAPAIEYIVSGSKLVHREIANVTSDRDLRSELGHILRNKDYTQYEDRISTTVPNKIRNMKNKIERVALRMGMKDKERNEKVLEKVIKSYKQVSKVR